MDLKQLRGGRFCLSHVGWVPFPSSGARLTLERETDVARSRSEEQIRRSLPPTCRALASLGSVVVSGFRNAFGVITQSGSGTSSEQGMGV